MCVCVRGLKVEWAIVRGFPLERTRHAHTHTHTHTHTCTHTRVASTVCGRGYRSPPFINETLHTQTLLQAHPAHNNYKATK